MPLLDGDVLLLNPLFPHACCKPFATRDAAAERKDGDWYVASGPQRFSIVAYTPAAIADIAARGFTTM